jgi:hypothetical protein
MHLPQGLALHEFAGSTDPLGVLLGQQVGYLRGYLADLDAATIIEEPNYFDRDYLAEFSAFYSISAAGYTNICRRLHFFSGPLLDRSAIENAASGDRAGIAVLQDRYLGFVVLRPIPQAPLGRTVLRWYPEGTPQTPRVINPSRQYKCNVAGIRLVVNGLAWQQQDTGVGACATVALWTMFHSSAFDDHHAIPTTADITRSAHETASLGARVFPSDGLTPYQIAEAIKAWNLSPLIIEGNKKLENGHVAFDTTRLRASLTAFIRSGYPVLVIGNLDGCGAHAVCAVGFRSSGNPKIAPDATEIQDSWTEYFYVHDDNIGPNVRMKVSSGGEAEAVFTLDSPPTTAKREALSLPPAQSNNFTPMRFIVGVHLDLRTSAETLYRTALKMADGVRAASNFLIRKAGGRPSGNIVSARFVRLSDYLNIELKNTLEKSPTLLAKARLCLTENVRPMSLHIGAVRIGDENSAPIMDILYDTTDSDRNHPVFANIAYSKLAREAQLALTALPSWDFGVPIDAFEDPPN